MSIRKWKYSAVSCQFRISGLLPGPIAGDVSHPGYNHATYDLYTNLEDSTCTLYSLASQGTVFDSVVDAGKRILSSETSEMRRSYKYLQHKFEYR